MEGGAGRGRGGVRPEPRGARHGPGAVVRRAHAGTADR